MSLENIQVRLNSAMDTLAARAKYARQQRGLTQTQASDASGVKQSDISKIERGETLRPVGLLALARAYGVNAHWLDTGDGDMLGKTEEANVASAPSSMRPRRYPVISSVQAGEWAEIVDQFAPGDAEDWQDSPVDLGANGFILKLEGNSMTNPLGGRDNFPEGMFVHIHPGIEAQPGDYVVAKRDGDNKATFKKLVRVDGEQFLHAINPAWPKPYLKLEPGDRIIGKLKFAGWSF